MQYILLLQGAKGDTCCHAHAACASPTEGTGAEAEGEERGEEEEERRLIKWTSSVGSVSCNPPKRTTPRAVAAAIPPLRAPGRGQRVMLAASSLRCHFIESRSKTYKSGAGLLQREREREREIQKTGKRDRRATAARTRKKSTHTHTHTHTHTYTHLHTRNVHRCLRMIDRDKYMAPRCGMPICPRPPKITMALDSPVCPWKKAEACA